MKVIAQANEYSGFHGDVLEVATDGTFLVAVEVKSVVTWNVSFNPHDIKLEQRTNLRRPNG